MLLGQISYVDCLVFVVLAIPQILLRVDFSDLMLCGLEALPFLCRYAKAGNLSSSRADHQSRFSSPLPIRCREIETKETTITVCPTIVSISRYRCEMCSICICKHSSQHWQSLFLSACGSTISEVPPAPSWLLEISAELG